MASAAASSDPHEPERINCARFFAPAIQLSLAEVGEAPKEIPEFKWIHCCNEGDYQGHHQGPFQMTRAVFDSFVKNLREDPQYKAGTLALSDGKTHTGGVHPVIQFDYEHASEMPPWEGAIAQSGAPAPGWVLDVEVRQSSDGKAQLWAFAQLGEKVREQIRRNEYRSVSIAFTLEGVHWVSNENIGPMLTSIAFTNHPFMRDLLPVAARRGGSHDPRSVNRSQPEEAPGSPSTNPKENDMSEQLHARICKVLNVKLLQEDAVVDAVAEAASGAGDLTSLLEALGVAGAADAMKVIPELRAAQSRLQSLMAELDSLMQQDMQQDQAIAEADVAAAMSAQRYQGDGAKRALVAYRKQLVTEEIAKLSKDGAEATLSQKRAARTEARKRFLSEYGITDPAKVNLTRSVAAGPNGQQLKPGESRSIAVGDDAAQTIDLTGLEGRNTTEKLIAYCCKNTKGFSALPLETQIARVANLRSRVAA